MDSAIFQMKLTGGMANTADAIGFVGSLRKGPSLRHREEQQRLEEPAVLPDKRVTPGRAGQQQRINTAKLTAKPQQKRVVTNNNESKHNRHLRKPRINHKVQKLRKNHDKTTDQWINTPSSHTAIPAIIIIISEMTEGTKPNEIKADTHQQTRRY